LYRGSNAVAMRKISTPSIPVTRRWKSSRAADLYRT